MPSAPACGMTTSRCASRARGHYNEALLIGSAKPQAMDPRSAASRPARLARGHRGIFAKHGEPAGITSTDADVQIGIAQVHLNHTRNLALARYSPRRRERVSA